MRELEINKYTGNKRGIKLNNNTDIIHLPDRLFTQFCNDQFGINRGVYNTIDSWFFQKGITNIMERRKSIYDFLNKWIQDDTGDYHGKIKIGHGNLTRKLNEYFLSHENMISKKKLVT